MAAATTAVVGMAGVAAEVVMTGAAMAMATLAEQAAGLGTAKEGVGEVEEMEVGCRKSRRRRATSPHMRSERGPV